MTINISIHWAQRMKYRDRRPPPRSSKPNNTCIIVKLVMYQHKDPALWQCFMSPAQLMRCHVAPCSALHGAVNPDLTVRTSLPALNGILAPAPHALAEALEEFLRALVPALALLAVCVAPAAHALAQIVIACMPD